MMRNRLARLLVPTWLRRRRKVALVSMSRIAFEPPPPEVLERYKQLMLDAMHEGLRGVDVAEMMEREMRNRPPYQPKHFMYKSIRSDDDPAPRP